MPHDHCYTIPAGASQTIPNKYRDTPIDLLSPTKPEDQEVRELMLEERGREELFDGGDIVGEDDLAGQSFVRSLRLVTEPTQIVAAADRVFDTS